MIVKEKSINRRNCRRLTPEERRPGEKAKVRSRKSSGEFLAFSLHTFGISHLPKPGRSRQRRTEGRGSCSFNRSAVRPLSEQMGLAISRRGMRGAVSRAWRHDDASFFYYD
eukprot:2257378-Rhodomonas_salina.1